MQSKLLFTLAIIVLVALADGKKKNKKNKNAGGGGGSAEFESRGPFFALNVNLGSNSETLNVGIESYYGASVFYGPSIQCNGMDSYCIDHKTIDITTSNTWKIAENGRIHNFNLALGTASGQAGNDALYVGNVGLPSAMFGVADTGSTNLMRKSRTSGYLAMGSPVMKPEDKTTIQLLCEKADKPIITLQAPSGEVFSQGMHSVVIGAEDTKHCPKDGWRVFPSVTPIDPNTDNQPWSIQLSGGYTLGSISDPTMITAAISTAGDYFVAPKAVANRIYSQLNAQYSYDYHGGLVSCDKIASSPDLVLKSDKGDFTIPAKDYIKRFNRSTCLLNLYPDEVPMWTLPYQFLQGKCAKFDYGAKTVSFVMAKSS